jgi:prepilin-type N-terminal cleavage/methylation domain-containing protein
MSKSRSFTLIEILVAMAIIGILSGMILVFTNGAINNAKDAKMKEDMEQLNKTFSMYNAANGAYPSTNGTTCNVGDPSATGSCATLNAALIPAYYANVPTNPNTGSYYTYQSAAGTDYTLAGTLSNTYAYQYSPSSGYATATPVNGACGSSSGGSFASAPSTNLCSTGTATSVSGSGLWTWGCNGSNGGTSTSSTACTASYSKSAYVTNNCPASASCTLVSGTDMVIQWTTVGSYTWTVPTSGSLSVQYLVVGGGGGGKIGGGGAGGFLTSTSFTVSGSIPVTVGSGGSPGAKGGNSIFSSITAVGGGHGGESDIASPDLSGGSGGGGGFLSSVLGSGGRQSGGSPALSQGYSGGYGQYDGTQYGGGGGGGGGSAGGAYTAPANGGAGLSSSITGSVAWYAGGGGGGGRSITPGSASSGGGAGSVSTGSAGTANTGGGGGGGLFADNGGAGGSGIVIVRFAIP